MYLGRVYRNHQHVAKWSIRKLNLIEVLQCVCAQMQDTEEGMWSKITVVDMKHRTLILIWERGVNGRPNHPSLPSSKKG